MSDMQKILELTRRYANEVAGAVEHQCAGRTEAANRLDAKSAATYEELQRLVKYGMDTPITSDESTTISSSQIPTQRDKIAKAISDSVMTYPPAESMVCINIDRAVNEIMLVLDAKEPPIVEAKPGWTLVVTPRWVERPKKGGLIYHDAIWGVWDTELNVQVGKVTWDPDEHNSGFVGSMSPSGDESTQWEIVCLLPDVFAAAKVVWTMSKRIATWNPQPFLLEGVEE